MTATESEVQDEDLQLLPDEPVADLEEILPLDPEPLLIGGIEVRVNRLKTIEMLKLLRVVSHGLGPALGELTFSTEDSEQLRTEIVSVFVLALPDAITEFVEFLLTVVQPVNEKDRKALAKELVNPEVEDLILLVERVVDQEYDDLYVLVGKARVIIDRMKVNMASRMPKRADG